MSEKLIYIKSYGCQMNVYDSNRIKDLFLDKGYKITDDVNKANLTVLNTCHIREKAVEKVYSDIGRIKKIKDTNKDMQLVVAGCVAQAEGNEIKKRSPVVDFVVGPQSYHKLPDMIDELEPPLNSDFLQNEKLLQEWHRMIQQITGSGEELQKEQIKKSLGNTIEIKDAMVIE